MQTRKNVFFKNTAQLIMIHFEDNYFTCQLCGVLDILQFESELELLCESELSTYALRIGDIPLSCSEFASPLDDKRVPRSNFPPSPLTRVNACLCLDSCRYF